MVSFLQKNAAKIVIISGAALISTISGGCDTECTQDSTKSAKCDKGTKEQKEKCTGDDKVVSTIVLCKGKTCEDSEFAPSGRCCTKKTVTASTTDGAEIDPCSTEGTKYTNKKCFQDKCGDNKYRVKLAIGNKGCLALCEGDGRQDDECACVEKDSGSPKKGGKQNLCAQDHICKTTGVVEFPVCAVGDKKFNSNCYYGSQDPKTTLCTGWSDGAKCTDTVIGDNEIAITEYAVCKKNAAITKSGVNPAASASEAAKVAICDKGQICKIGPGDAASCKPVANSGAVPCASTSGGAPNISTNGPKVTNCTYATSSYCGVRNGKEYLYNFADKTCLPKCKDTGNTETCSCLKKEDSTVGAVCGGGEATKVKCEAAGTCAAAA